MLGYGTSAGSGSLGGERLPLNNLVLSSGLGERRAEDVPEPRVRLHPSKVAAFVFDPRGVTDMVDHETGFISEAELGKVAENLSEQMNAIAMLRRQADAGDET
jgi:hypothetical protein